MRIRREEKKPTLNEKRTATTKKSIYKADEKSERTHHQMKNIQRMIRRNDTAKNVGSVRECVCVRASV